METATIRTAPIPGQKPGTSGLRKKTRVFMGPHYLENYVQAIFDGIGGVAGKTLVLGGDGRFFNDRASQVILRMAAANGAAKVIVGRDALLSTPAASHLIRLRQTDGGLILSASHNPGGEHEDFGLKYNTPNGGPAPEGVTDRIFEATTTIAEYHILVAQDVDLSRLGTASLGGMGSRWSTPSPTTRADGAALRLRRAPPPLRLGLHHALRRDARDHRAPMRARSSRPASAPPRARSSTPSPCPTSAAATRTPNPTWAKELFDLMMGPQAPDFGAASDGDGDRNMILGRGAYVSPSDSLAVLTAHAHRAPATARG
jgi:phosphoglucomutase